MRLTVNGEQRELQRGTRTVDDLLRALELPLDRVAVEVNGALVRRGERAARPLQDGDVVEIVTLVGGG